MEVVVVVVVEEEGEDDTVQRKPSLPWVHLREVGNPEGWSRTEEVGGAVAATMKGSRKGSANAAVEAPMPPPTNAKHAAPTLLGCEVQGCTPPANAAREGDRKKDVEAVGPTGAHVTSTRSPKAGKPGRSTVSGVHISPQATTAFVGERESTGKLTTVPPEVTGDPSWRVGK